MRLTKDKVKHVAKLANLPLNEVEKEKYSEQLSKILDYVNQLNSVDTAKLEPTFNISSEKSVLAEDQPGECLSQDEALSNASQEKDGFFATKGIFDNE